MTSLAGNTVRLPFPCTGIIAGGVTRHAGGLSLQDWKITTRCRIAGCHREFLVTCHTVGGLSEYVIGLDFAVRPKTPGIVHVRVALFAIGGCPRQWRSPILRADIDPRPPGRRGRVCVWACLYLEFCWLVRFFRRSSHSPMDSRIVTGRRMRRTSKVSAAKASFMGVLHSDY
jgi:hypothetical protein